MEPILCSTPMITSTAVAVMHPLHQSDAQIQCSRLKGSGASRIPSILTLRTKEKCGISWEHEQEQERHR